VTVAAHGHVTNIVINRDLYSGFLPDIFSSMANRPIVAGWTTSSTNNGFIGPESFASADIICHKNSSNAKGYAVVAAGDNISLQWNTWPESHRGPVIDYLPDCGSTDCEAVDKNSLQFFKIGEVGLIDGSKAPGTWAQTNRLPITIHGSSRSLRLSPLGSTFSATRSSLSTRVANTMAPRTTRNASTSK